MDPSSLTNKTQNPIPMVDLRAQYATIREQIRAAIEAVLDSQHFILGPQVQALEEEIARYCGRRFAVGVASGTDALILALRACGIGPGDEVIVPSFSFIATADSVSLLGATPVFVDIQPETFCINPAKIAAKITPRTRAVIPVHLYGQPADMDPILELAHQHNLKVIEDNAHAIGATYKGKKTASLGDAGCISFYPSKNLGAYGDGGMIVTDSEELCRHLRSLRNHGSTKRYFSEEQGWNSRLDEIQAAILRVKLRHLDAWNAGRRANAAHYDALLNRLPGVVVPKVAPWGEHVFHQYTIRVPHRDRVQKVLADQGIASTVYYPTPVHLQPIYASLQHQPGDLPETERAAAEVLSLPMYPELTVTQIERVVDVVSSALQA
ncbi:MAG TPA: DegT/DnrJ/EryC1/StrS family aminotransferase [Candidatus Acidoferrales bacterium]